MKQKMCCRRVAEYLCTHLDEELSSQRCKEIRKHLATCTHCAELLRSLKRIIAFYRKTSAPKLSRKERTQRFKNLLAGIKAQQ